GRGPRSDWWKSPLRARGHASARDARAARSAGPTCVPLPDTVRAVIRRRLAPLSADAVQVLAAAAVVGRTFDLALVDAACELSTERIIASLAEATSLGMIVEIPGAVRSFGFSHPLTREAIYEGLPVAARAQMHQRVGLAIE